tara:strand:+ start:1026 stop:1613 length:588 start_codon:yes stop_codon:yes gene_type:complete
MIKKTILFLLLILGCQKNWLDSEKNDFKARCNNPDIIFEEIYYDAEHFTDALNGRYDEGEDFIDAKNGKWDEGEEFVDANDNGKWDAAEHFIDALNGKYDEGEDFTDALNGRYDEGEEFVDVNDNEKWDDAEYLKNKTNKLTVNKEERAIFCDCILSQLLLLDLSYDDFLEKDLKTLDTQNDISISQITNACPVE